MNDKIIGLGLTFEDVLVIPALSKVLPRQASLKTRLAGDLNLNMPLLSAAMDTVTESKMAIVMARQGGIGIIHKGCPIKVQVEKISAVKRSQSAVISKPKTLTPANRLADVVYQLLGGLRSGMGYVGAANITELQQAKFIQVTPAGQRESHPHNIMNIQASPNYQIQQERK